MLVVSHPPRVDNFTDRRFDLSAEGGRGPLVGGGPREAGSKAAGPGSSQGEDVFIAVPFQMAYDKTSYVNGCAAFSYPARIRPWP